MARGGNRPAGAQGLGAGRSEAAGAATTRALEFEEWWDTPPEAVFKPRQRVSRGGQHGDQTGCSDHHNGDQDHHGQGQRNHIDCNGKVQRRAKRQDQQISWRPVAT
jgi:hypothetical protein